MSCFEDLNALSVTFSIFLLKTCSFSKKKLNLDPQLSIRLNICFLAEYVFVENNRSDNFLIRSKCRDIARHPTEKFILILPKFCIFGKVMEYEDFLFFSLMHGKEIYNYLQYILIA
jgi:hypothetical protein